MERALHCLVDKFDGPKRNKRSRNGPYSMSRAVRSSPSSDGSESTHSSSNTQGQDLEIIQASSSDRLEFSLRGCSLASHCEQLRDVIGDLYFEHNGDNASLTSGKPSIDACISQLFDCINRKRNLEILDDGSPVDLPPRSLLAMACIPFFQSDDFATDLFDQDCFRQNVERIYGHPYRSQDAAWAVCFNLVILLGLGVDQPVSSSRDFMRPFLLNAMRAYVSMTIVLTPELIHVQALALLVSDCFVDSTILHLRLILLRVVEYSGTTVFPPSAPGTHH